MSRAHDAATARRPITVAVSRFDDLLALGLHALLAGDPSLDVVAEDIAPERLDVVLRAHRPRVLVVDLAALPDLAQVRRLSLEHPETRLVVLGGTLSSAESAQLLAFGASACLGKSAHGRDIGHAIHLASRGLQLTPIGPSGSGMARAEEALLTRREGDVLLLLRQDRSNAQIALELRIGVETVRSHARNVYRKLGVTSRRELIALPPPTAPSPSAPVAPSGRRHASARAASRRPRRS